MCGGNDGSYKSFVRIKNGSVCVAVQVGDGEEIRLLYPRDLKIAQLKTFLGMSLGMTWNPGGPDSMIVLYNDGRSWAHMDQDDNNTQPIYSVRPVPLLVDFRSGRSEQQQRDYKTVLLLIVEGGSIEVSRTVIACEPPSRQIRGILQDARLWRRDTRIARLSHGRIDSIVDGESLLSFFEGRFLTFQIDFSPVVDFLLPVAVDGDDKLVSFWLEVIPGEKFRDTKTRIFRIAKLESVRAKYVCNVMWKEQQAPRMRDDHELMELYGVIKGISVHRHQSGGSSVGVRIRN
jgi:hypothetical protein